MAFPIRPRYRSGSAGNPTSLELAELAVNTHDGSVYLGADVGVVQIGIPVAAGTEETTWTANGSASQFAPLNGYNGTDVGGYLVTVQGIQQPFSVTADNGGTLVFDFTPPAGSVIRARAITQAMGGGGGSGDATSLQGTDVSATAPADGQILVAIGDPLVWTPSSATVLGVGATSSSATGVAIGDGATITNEYGNDGHVAIGENAEARSNGISIGKNSLSYDAFSIAIGENSLAAAQGIAIGYNQSATGGGEINIGGIRLDLVKSKVNEIITWANANGATIDPLA